jgi:hypothetical protein
MARIAEDTTNRPELDVLADAHSIEEGLSIAQTSGRSAMSRDMPSSVAFVRLLRCSGHAVAASNVHLGSPSVVETWKEEDVYPYDGEPTFIPKDIEGKENLAYYHVLYDQSRIGFKIDRAFASAEFRVDDGPADGGCWSY